MLIGDYAVERALFGWLHALELDLKSGKVFAPIDFWLFGFCVLHLS